MSENTQPSGGQGGDSRRTWVWRVIPFLGVVAVGITLAAFYLPSLSGTKKKSFLTHTVKRGSLDVTVTADGLLESSNNIEIKCKVKGGSTVLWVIETGTTVAPGDILVELDRSQIEDNVMQRQISYENALANKIIAESDVKVADTSITEYIEGTYKETRSGIEKEIFDAEEAVKTARLSLDSARRLAAKGMVRSLQLEGIQFSVESALKDLELKRTRLVALEKYTKVKMLQELRSALSAAQARLAADDAALNLELQRLEREREQLENCTIRTQSAGLVIFPSMADWKSTPDIEEGAVVREQQTLLMIPDVDQMQVKVGIHESKVDRLKIGMLAKIQLQGVSIEGEVQEIAEVTRPSGWWTGNLVKYDTIIKLRPQSGLKPGMSAVVEVVLASHQDVLTAPVASIIETPEGFLCWVLDADGETVEKRSVQVGDTNDEFVLITSGLAEGDQVVLNPMGVLSEAEQDAILTTGPLVDATDTGPAEKKPELSGSSAAVTPASPQPPGQPVSKKQKSQPASAQNQ